MLRAANSLRLRRSRPAGPINAMNRIGIHPHLQQRNYIFLPASFQELSQMISEAWSSQQAKRRTVWVKLWQRPKLHDANNSITNTTNDSLPTRITRKRKSLSSKAKRFRMRHHKSYIASKRRFQNAKRLFREEATVRMNRLHQQFWEYKPLRITEPAQADWFDKDGYPRAARNTYGRFVNPWNSQSTNGMQSLWLFFQWRMERLYNTFINHTNSNASMLPYTDTTRKLAFQTTPPPKDQIRCTWLGHSTTLVELDGFIVLTDPIFSQRASPFASWGGASRLAPVPCTIDDLPSRIDVCVISHDHYDHLDLPSVLQLKSKVEVWAVPLGMSEWLQDSCDIHPSQILEQSWWESAKLERMNDGRLQKVTSSSNNNSNKNVLQVTCAPAQHWCGRNMLDRNQRLWCSWVVGVGSLKYFFAGDTALPESFPLHRQIGDRLGPFDVAALPIGAYAPSYFMKVSHTDPTEAVKIHESLGAKKSMAIHWGTFHLSEEAYNEPPRLLQQAAEKAGIDFVAVSQGECIVGPDVDVQEDVNDGSAKVVEDADNDSHDEQVEYG